MLDMLGTGELTMKSDDKANVAVAVCLFIYGIALILAGILIRGGMSFG